MKKLDLDKLKVQSFVTSLDTSQDNTIKGGQKVPKSDHGVGLCKTNEDGCVAYSEGMQLTCAQLICG